MKGFLLIILSFISVCSFCQGQTDENTVKCSVIVKQSFHGWTHCHINPKPRWYSSSIKNIKKAKNDDAVAFNSGDNEIILQDIEIKRDDTQGSIHYEFASNKIDLKYTLDVANIKKHGHYVDTITIGYNKHDKIEDGRDAHCFMKKDEGYSFSLSFIIDDPIYLTRKSGNNKYFVIEDNEKLEVSFNDFYENNNADRIFQYRIKDGEWTNFNKSFNDRVSITPKGSVKIGYEDIFGNDPQDKDYLNGSGKQIQIRVLKTLSGEKKIKTPSNVIPARFYHRGPTFTVENVRWPACNDSVEVFVNIDSESLKHVKSLKGKYKWEAAHFLPGKKSPDRSFDVFYGPTSIPNRYKLLLVDQEDESKDFLSREDAQTGKFKLQLQLKDEKGDNIKGLAFCAQEFTIPQKLEPIQVSQSEGYLFELDGKKYHLYNKNNPYVVLNITDNDQPEKGRLPYKIYDSAGKLLAEITDKIDIKEDNLRGDFEEEYVYDSLATEWAKEWFGKNTNLAKVERIDTEIVSAGLGNSSVKPDSVPVLVMRVGDSDSIYLSYDCKTLYIMKGIWKSDYYSGGIDNGQTIYIGKDKDNALNYGLYIEKSSENGVYDRVDAKDIGELIQGDNRFLVLRNSNGNYTIIDIYCKKQIEVSDLLFNTSKVHVNSNGDVVVVNENEVKLYKYNKGIWDSGTIIKLQFSPKSAKNVVFEDNYNNVKYTASDGNSYREYNNITENKFIGFWEKGNAAYLPEDAFKKRYDRLWQQYYLQNAGYHIHGIKINQNDTLILIDNDGCSYTIPYRVNVLDALQIDEVAKSNPKLGNSADGTAELKVTPGGTEDYYYNGKKIKEPETINLLDLKWGANEVVFTDEKRSTIKTYIVYLTPQVTATSKAQTCAEANGSIAVSGSDTSTQWRCYNSKVAPIEYTKLTGLKAGQYVVQGIYGGNWINVDTIEVEDKIFSASFVSKNDAPAIGEKGTAIIKVRNVDGNLSWFEGDEKIDNCSYNAQNSTATVPLSKGTHVIVASDNKNCPSPEVNVTIDGPTMMNAEVFVENENGNVSVNLSAGFEKVTKRNLVLYNQQNEIVASSQNNELQLDSASVKLNDVYSLDLQYEVDGKSGITQTLNLFEDLTPLRLTTATQYTADTLRCYGTKDIVKVAIDEKKSNIGDKVEYKIGSSKWKTLSSDGKNEEVDVGNCSITYMTDTTEVEDFAKVVNRATYTKELTIKPGKKYDHDVEFNDVVCLGKDKGSIVLTPDSSRTIESVWLRKDNVDYKSGVISGLDTGIYTITVIDGRCPEKEDVRTDTIHAPQKELKITKSTIIIDPTCHEKDGVIELEVSGGWGGYRKITDLDEYNKDNESYLEKVIASDNGILRFDSISSGKRNFTIVDEGLCVLTYPIEIPEYKNPYITKAELDATSCYGTSDGAIRILSVQTNSSKVCVDSVYIRKDDEETKKAYDTIYDGLPVGDYKLLLVDENGCKADNEFTVHISQPEPLKVEARLLDEGRILYEGGNTGRMEVKVSGGNVGIDSVFYNNSNVLVSTGVPYIVEGMSAGPISITASDRYNCPCNDTTLTFIEPEEPITIETESQAALCHAQTGSVKVTATGGWGDHIIRLVGERESRNSGEQSETTFESLYAGDYEIEVEDKHGAKATQTVRVDAPEPISHEFAMTPDHCDGNGGGMIELSGGTGDYVSLFNMGADSIHGNRILVGNLVGGREYTLTTWDANRCESRMTFTMPDEQLTAEIKYAYNANGSATLTAEVKGGIAPYTYKWRNVSGGEELGTSSTQTVTKSGLYRLEIADASGCSYNTMQDVLMAGSIVMRVKSVTRATNPENNNGTATIICKATQPTELRLYHLETDTWTSSITMQDETTIKLEGLRPGHYSVEGELGDGSKQMAQFYIAPYEPMEVTKLDVKHVSAPGRSDASVVVDFVGGIAPYTVNDTATYETSHIVLTNLAAGSIALSVADSTGNVLTKDVEILEPEPLVVTPSRVDSASCFSYSDGSVQLTAIGGWPGYQFANGNGDYRNSAYFGELNAGERTFKVVDKYGVEDSVKVTVGEPDMLRALVSAIDSVSCKGLNDGAAHFTLTGGTAPYRTIYEKETLDGTDVAHLLSGSYVMKFTDSHNCKSPDTISIYIPEPDLLELANDYVTHTTCELDNGKIAIEVKGGSLPYRYEWKENGATYGGAKTVNMVRSEAENLKQNGLYHIDITDLHGCHTQYEMRIEHSENPRVMGVATTDVLCYGSSDGIAEVDSSQVKWGYPKVNYHLTWPQGQTGVMSVNTLPAGTHIVRITDDNNCTTTREFTVGTPEPVKNHLASVRDALCYGYSDGRIETHTTGGVGDYTYVWNTGETTSYADSLKAGLYTIVVTDSHECIDSATYEVGEPEELKVNLGNDVLICPGNIHVFDAGEYATYSWRHAASGEEIATERYLATGDEGDYAIKVTDEIGCIARDTVNITIGENALEANFLMASDAAVNDTIMLVELSNLPVDSVRWEYEPLTVVDIDDAENYMLNLSAENTGRYYITMWAYSGGCESFEQKFIDIYEAVADTSDFKIGYAPLIKQAKVSPNPNDGEFDLIVVLRETYDIDVTVYDVNNGRQVEHVVLKDSDRYNTRLNIRQWGSGIFVLSVSSGTERKAIKVLCVR